MEELMNNFIIWLILSLATIFSLIWGIYSHVKSREKIELSYDTKSNVLIRNQKYRFNNLSIKYNNKEIDDLCVSRFVIWNSGNRVINANDIVKTKEITLQIRDTEEILDANIIAVTEETNNFSLLTIDHKTIKVVFDYINQKDGVVIQIIHTGLSGDVTISCKIKGGEQLKKYGEKTENIIEIRNTPFSKKRSAIDWIIRAILVIGAFIFIDIEVLIVGLEKNGIIPDQESFKSPPFVYFIMFPFCVIMTIIVAIMFYRGFIDGFKVGIPDKIKDKFTDN